MIKTVSLGSLFALTAAGTAFGASYPNPYITGFFPTSGPAGTVVSVTGSGFTGLNAAWIGNGHDASVHVVNDSLVKITVPADASTAHIAVLNPQNSHFSSVNFTVSGSGSANTSSGSSSSSTSTGSTSTASNTAATVTGRVVGLKNVRLILAGVTNQFVTTDANGYFTFSNVGNGSYTVAPGDSGHVSTPTSTAVIISGKSVSGLSFSAKATSAATYTLTGTVSGTALAGVIITLNGANTGTATTDTSGNYGFEGLSTGTYTVSAAVNGHSFSKPHLLTIGRANVTAVNFSSTSAGVTPLSFAALDPLPNATVGSPYTHTVVKSISGSSSVHFQTDSAVAGAPPVNMLVNPNGNLTGTPSAAGKYAFTVCAVDATGAKTNACGATALTVVAAAGSSTTPPPVTTSPPVTPPASGTSWVFYNGQFDWPGDYSFEATPNYKDTSGDPLSGTYDIKVTINSPWGGWQPYAQNWNFNAASYNYLTFSLKPTVANQKWNVYFMNVGDTAVVGSNGQQIYIDPTQYGPAPVVGQWNTYKIPLSVLGVAGKSIYKFCIHDETGLSNNVWYVDNAGFSP